MRKRGRLIAMSLVMLVVIGAGLALSRPVARTALTRSPNCSAICLELPRKEYRRMLSDKEYAAGVNVRYLSADGTRDEAFEAASIHGHGNSSWSEDKKSWTVTFNEPAGLLGTKSARKYCLIGAAQDTTYLRNRITYQIARENNPEWSPDCELTELFLNGEYAGLYLLVERPHEDNGVLISDTAAGSFLVEHDNGGQTEGLTFLERICIREQNGISSDEIAQRLGAVDRALRSADGIDKVSGKAWDELIDPDSFARAFLVNELAGNGDVVVTSSYFYCKGNGDERLYAGPVWDFDRAYGRENAKTDGLITVQSHYETWFQTAYGKAEFHERVCELYEQEYLPQARALANGGIAAQAAEIAQAAARDQSKWGNYARELTEIGAVSDEVTDAEAMQGWLRGRIEFLDRCWIDREETNGKTKTQDISREQMRREEYVSIAGAGLWGWLVHHRLLLEAAALGAAAGGAFLALLIRDHRRCTGRG